MATELVKITPTNIVDHPFIRDGLRVVKNTKVCVYRNGLLTGLMQGRWVVVPFHGCISLLGFEKEFKMYCIRNPVKAETDSEVFFVPDIRALPHETADEDQSDYLVLKVYVR